MRKRGLSKLIGLGTAGIAMTGLYLKVLRPWHMRWGATSEEVDQALPGDELVATPKQVTTRAITIRARAEG